MKRINYLIIILISTLFLGSCELDERNDDLTVGFSGTLIDKTTGAIVPTDHTGNRAKLNFIDLAYGDNAQKIRYNIMADGYYINTKVFPAKYKIFAEGPFVSVDTITLDMNSFKEFNLSVVPYTSLSILSSELKADNNLEVTYKYKVNIDTVTVKKIGLFYSKIPHPGDSEVDGKNVFFKKITVSEQEGTLTDVIKLDDASTYFLRAGSNVDDEETHFNYSTQITVETN
jgi:hypothetical protein